MQRVGMQPIEKIDKNFLWAALRFELILQTLQNDHKKPNKGGNKTTAIQAQIA